MSVLTKSTRSQAALLRTGMQLRQPEFHRRYEQYPDDTKFELIDGEVFMASPAGGDHGVNTASLSGVFFHYSARTLGVQIAENMTTILGWDSEPQPDLLLRLLPEYGGQSHFNEN